MMSVLRSLRREKPRASLLPAAVREKGLGAPRQGLARRKKNFAGVGVGLYNLCWGHAPPKVFVLVQGYVEIGCVLW